VGACYSFIFIDLFESEAYFDVLFIFQTGFLSDRKSRVCRVAAPARLYLTYPRRAFY